MLSQIPRGIFLLSQMPRGILHGCPWMVAVGELPFGIRAGPDECGDMWAHTIRGDGLSAQQECCSL